MFYMSLSYLLRDQREAHLNPFLTFSRRLPHTRMDGVGGILNDMVSSDQPAHTIPQGFVCVCFRCGAKPLNRLESEIPLRRATRFYSMFEMRQTLNFVYIWLWGTLVGERIRNVWVVCGKAMCIWNSEAIITILHVFCWIQFFFCNFFF